MPAQKIVDETKAKMKKAADVLHDELKVIRTAKASSSLVDNIKVECYGTVTALKQLAAIAAPQADMIVIKPFDPGIVRDIEKAIKASELSIAPVVDGKMIRLNVPPLSHERRTQLVAQVKQTGEQAKVTVRNIRRDANKHLEKHQKDKIITEDDMDLGEKQIDQVTKEYTEKIDSMVEAKSREIMLE